MYEGLYKINLIDLIDVVPGQQPVPQRDQDKGDDCGLQEKEDHAAGLYAGGAQLILIDKAVVEQVESFTFHGVHFTTNYHGPNTLRQSGTTKPIPPKETEKIWRGSSDPQKVLQLHHREHH